MTDTEILEWAKEGIGREADYLLVAFDKKTREELPIFVYKNSNIVEEIKKIFNCWYLQIVGIIDLKGDIHKQASNLYSLNGQVFRN
jgi:hypothetical protein